MENYGVQNMEILEEIEIGEKIDIGPSQTVEVENKEIHLNATIANQGTLSFRNCIIHYGEKKSDNSGISAGTVTMEDCTVVCHGLENAEFKQCEFCGCRGELFTHSKDIQIRNCTFHNCSCKKDKQTSGLGLLSGGEWDADEAKALLYFGSYSVIEDCEFTDINTYYHFLIKGDEPDAVGVKNCRFTNCKTLRKDQGLICEHNDDGELLVSVSDCTGL